MPQQSTLASNRPPNEATTRRDQIDPQLLRAGWDVANSNQVGIEIPVDGFDPAAWQALSAQLKQLREAGATYDVELPSGISDYALYRANGEIIAVVEAKKASYNSRLAQAQAAFYVREIAKKQSFQPFAFVSHDERSRSSSLSTTRLRRPGLRSTRAKPLSWRGACSSPAAGAGMPT